MAERRYDIQFAGELVEGAEAGIVRGRLRERFKLSPEALERLFSGRPVVVKHNLDEAAALRYRAAFREAGAILRIDAVDAPALDRPTAARSGPEGPGSLASGGLTLAPPGTEVGEAPRPGPRDIDTSHLSLIGGNDWTLADCDRPPPPAPIPDLSHLALAPMEPAHRRPPSPFDD
jgi:hypothetical protein